MKSLGTKTRSISLGGLSHNDYTTNTLMGILSTLSSRMHILTSTNESFKTVLFIL